MTKARNLIIDLIKSIKINKKSFDYIDLFTVFLLTASAISMIALRFSRFSPSYVLIISLALTIIIATLFSKEILIPKFNKKSALLLIILLMALFFRLNPPIYLSGGQDEGLYINMSKSFELEGDWHPTDEFRQSLDSEQRVQYDKNGTGIQAGINVISKEDSERVMPFYPLYPALLSLTGAVFGSDQRVFFLTIMSLLTVLLFYKIGILLTNRRFVGYTAALILAVSPLHIFFSKFPVTEIVSMGFVFLGLYYLLKYKESVLNNQNGIINLLFLSGIISAFYLTRLSFLLYIPFLIVILAIGLCIVTKKKVKKEIIIFSGVSVLLLLISTYIYFKFAYTSLFLPVYQSLLESVLGANYNIFLPIMVLATIIILILIINGEIRLNKLIALIFTKYWKLIILLILLIVLSSFALSLYQLGFTNQYINDLINNYYLVNSGFSSIQYVFLFVVFSYLSPFIVIIFVIGLFFSKIENLTTKLVILFTLMFYLINSFFMKFTQYNYYYARYNLTEIVAFTILLASIFLGNYFYSKDNKKKVFSIVIICFTLIYCVFYALPLTKAQEGADKSFFEELNNTVGENDLILVNLEKFYPTNEILTPLNYYYNHSLINLKSPDEIDNPVVKSTYNKVNDVYLLSMETLDGYDISNTKILQFKFTYFSNCKRHIYSFLNPKDLELRDLSKLICETSIIPTIPLTNSITLYLYKIK
ncbi:MAG: hypothetical protein WCO33_04840 [bacterium]